MEEAEAHEAACVVAIPSRCPRRCTSQRSERCTYYLLSQAPRISRTYLMGALMCKYLSTSCVHFLAGIAMVNRVAAAAAAKAARIAASGQAPGAAEAKRQRMGLAEYKEYVPSSPMAAAITPHVGALVATVDDAYLTCRTCATHRLWQVRQTNGWLGTTPQPRHSGAVARRQVKGGGVQCA